MISLAVADHVIINLKYFIMVFEMNVTAIQYKCACKQQV